MVNFLNRIRIHFSCLCLCLIKDIALNQWKCVYVLFISLFISFGFIYICWFTSNFIINLPILSHERRFDYKIYRLWRTTVRTVYNGRILADASPAFGQSRFIAYPMGVHGGCIRCQRFSPWHILHFWVQKVETPSAVSQYRSS